MSAMVLVVGTAAIIIDRREPQIRDGIEVKGDWEIIGNITRLTLYLLQLTSPTKLLLLLRPQHPNRIPFIN